MGVIGWIVVGFVAGALANRVTGAGRQGCITKIAIGILGGLLGGALFNAAGDRGIDDFGLRSMLVAFVGATILLATFNVLGIGRRR